MKLRNLGEVNDFLDMINRCKGDIWLEDDAGSRINLKSRLSQYVAVGALLSEQGGLLNLVCGDPEDEAKFHLFLSDHPQIGG